LLFIGTLLVLFRLAPETGSAWDMRYFVCACAIICASVFFSIGLTVSEATDGGYALVASNGAAQ
jgi:hypothetical protein